MDPTREDASPPTQAAAFGEWLTSARARAKISQRQLAAAANEHIPPGGTRVDQSMVSRYQKGTEPSREVAVALVGALTSSDDERSQVLRTFGLVNDMSPPDPHAFDTLGQWLRDARKFLGLSQEALGAQIGRSQGNVAAYERGAAQIPDEVLERFVVRFPQLGVKLSDIAEHFGRARPTDPPLPESYADIGRWMAAVRTHLGISQQSFGSLLGIKAQTVWTNENGRTRPQLATVVRLAAVVARWGITYARIAEQFGYPVERASDPEQMAGPGEERLDVAQPAASPFPAVDPAQSLGSYVRTVRQWYGESQKAFAARVPLAEFTVARCEHDRQRLSTRQARQLHAKVLAENDVTWHDFASAYSYPLGFEELREPPRPRTFATSGEWLLAMRVKAGFNQHEMAEPLGMSAATLSRCESGLAMPRPRPLRRLRDLAGFDSEVVVEELVVHQDAIPEPDRDQHLWDLIRSRADSPAERRLRDLITADRLPMIERLARRYANSRAPYAPLVRHGTNLVDRAALAYVPRGKGFANYVRHSCVQEFYALANGTANLTRTAGPEVTPDPDGTAEGVELSADFFAPPHHSIPLGPAARARRPHRPT